MRFSTFLLAASAFVSAVFAAKSDDSSLHTELSPAFEQALLNEFGPVAFDAFQSSSCNVFSCALTIGQAAPCIVGCISSGGGIGCVAGCINLDKLCSCIGCLPKSVQDALHKIGICTDKAKAELFGKIYMGIANETEEKLAEQYGITKDSLIL